LNKGLRRRTNRTQFGFKIDPVSGYWEKNEDDPNEVKDPTASPRQWIVPSVQDRKNALLLQLVGDGLSGTTVATVQHALLRGIESTFQLEESEILAEPVPTRDERKGVLFYEATEGGAGVLTRLVAEPDSLATVARAALRIMHFDEGESPDLPENVEGLTDVAGTECVAACYRCLMSYFNQPDHELIDRRDEQARRILLRLARTRTSVDMGRQQRLPDAGGHSHESDNTSRARWREQLQTMGLPAPDLEPLNIAESRVECVWREHYAAALIGVAEHAVEQKLRDTGFEVVTFGDSENEWPENFTRLASALGRVS
jgi:hypothetical protein